MIPFDFSKLSPLLAPRHDDKQVFACSEAKPKTCPEAQHFKVNFLEKPSEASPPHLTGGESPKVKVDWCTSTFLPSLREPVDMACLNALRNVTGKPVEAVSCNGMFGYDYGMKFFIALDDGKEHHLARLDYGGGYHGQRARLDISGSGCSLVNSWHSVTNFIMSQMNPVLTRVDLAADFQNGEYNVEDCVNWYQSGLFNAGGRNPRHNMVGDWLNPVYGRTFEVGRRENGKMLRCYEKGRQLGDPDSKWTRFEVELRNIDRVIPFNILTECDHFFTGSYKCLQNLIEAVAQRIETDQTAAKISLEKLMVCVKASYGRLFNVLGLFMNPEEIFNEISRSGVPARLEKASLQGYLKNGLAAVPSIQEN